MLDQSVRGANPDHPLSRKELTSRPISQHINYAYWQQPLRNSLPPIASVLQWQATYPVTEIFTRYTVENSLGSWPGDNQYNCAQGTV
jgi:hypothetical protein